MYLYTKKRLDSKVNKKAKAKKQTSKKGEIEEVIVTDGF